MRKDNRRWLIVGLMVAWLATSSAVRAQTFLPPGSVQSEQSDPVKVRINAALHIADQALENGLPDVSQEAVRRAFRNGPPISTAEIRGLLNQFGGGRSSNATTVIRQLGGVSVAQVVRSSEVPAKPQNQYASRLVRLDARWEEANASPESCYALWRDLVLPRSRESQVFLYCSFRDSPGEPKPSFEPDVPKRRSSGAERLAYWAQAAGKVDELRGLLAKRKQTASQSDLLVIESYLALNLDDIPTELLDNVIEQTGALAHATSANEKVRAASLLIQKLDYDSPVRREFFKRLTRTAALTSNVDEWSWLLHTIMSEATEAISVDDRETLDACLAAASRVKKSASNTSRSETSVQRTLSSLYGAARLRALESKHVGLALYLLARKRLSSESKSRVLGNVQDTITVNGPTFQSLHSAPQHERYEMLKEVVWTLPKCSLADLATFAPTESIPERFVASYKEKHRKERLPIESVCGLGNSCMSLLEWYMRDAIELGHEHEVLAALERAEEKNAADAKLGRAVYSLAKNEPIDVNPFIEGSGNSARILGSAMDNQGVPLPIHFDIARSAIRDPATRSMGVEFAERLAQRGLHLTNEITLYGRHLSALGRLASKDPPLRSDDLKHFVRVDDFAYPSLVRGLPRESIWLQTYDGSLEHQACNTRSSLIVKYPLKGNFKVQFECFDQPFASSGATAMGLYLDFKAYSRSLGLDVIGFRKRDSRVASPLKSNQLFPIEIQRDSNQGITFVKSHEYVLGKFKTEEEAFPFFGMSAAASRKMMLQGFAISGDCEIPRSIELVTPRLWGWSAAFLERKLPPLGSLTTSGARSAKELRGKSAPQSIGYDWEYDHGELQSVNHKARYEADMAAGRRVNRRAHRPGEEWVYFGRPLCDGETLTLEFYQESGRFSLYPTIDRVAVQIGGHLREHWIGSDPQLFGLSANDYFDLPPERVLGKPKLNEKQWNTAELSRTGNRITVSINGTACYWQDVDSTFCGRFGLFCNPEQFHVRVRKVVLAGDWPEKLPNDLFALE